SATRSTAKSASGTRPAAAAAPRRGPHPARLPSDGVMLRLLACALVGAALGPLAAAQEPETLMPGVTFQQLTQLTPHGPVAYSAIRVPEPTGLTTIGPVLGAGTVTGPRETVTQLERSVSAVVTVAGVDGDFFSQSGGRSYPSGIVMQNG